MGKRMIPIFHAVLAAILGSGGSAAPVQHARIPVVTYGANALAQPGGAIDDKATKESTKSIKATPKPAVKNALKNKNAAKGEAAKKKA
jgi:hypothetical protein